MRRAPNETTAARRPARREGGFTMTELMVTVAILGILTYFSITGFKNDPVVDGSRKVTAAMSEARRRAVADGPIRDDVRAATGQIARTKVVFEANNLLRVWAVVEDAAPSTGFSWVNISSQRLPAGSEMYAVGTTAAIDPNGPLPSASSFGPALERRFYANGTCDSMTVYLRPSGPQASNTNKRYRVFAMPLNAIPASFKGW